jgi:putative hydrolase of the HAD superfamily
MMNIIRNCLIFIALFIATQSLTAKQAVVFDFAGVLATRNQEQMNTLLTTTFGFTPVELKQHYGEMVQAVDGGAAGSEVEFWVKLAHRKGLQLPSNWVTLHDATLTASVIIDLEMYALIHELKETGIQVGLLSNIDERLAKLLRAAGYYKPFDPCVLTCDIGVSKPDLKAYQILIEKMKCAPSKIIFVDDRLENVEAAKQVGIDAILFTSYAQIHTELAKRGLLVTLRAVHETDIDSNNLKN